MKEKDILLSVVIPTYNAANTIMRALEFAKKHNFGAKIEVIIINDGSTDNTKQVCEKFLKENKKQKVVFRLVNQPNAGHGSAINYGIKNAEGRYLRILDSDDFFDIDTFERYLDFLLECDSDLVCSDYNEIRGDEIDRFYWCNRKKSFVNKNYDNIINQTSPYLLPCATVRTEIIRKAHALVDEKCYYDDQEYDFLIIKLCKSVSYFAEPVYCYVVGNTEQSISQKNLKKNISDHQKVIEWLVRSYYDSCLTEKKKVFVFEKIIIPLCYQQYCIAVNLKKSRKDFLKFDAFLKEYKDLYSHPGVAGKRLKLHRILRGIFI